MAGVSVGESEENPVAINVTLLVDIIFCLCVFFMISFKFKQLVEEVRLVAAQGQGQLGGDRGGQHPRRGAGRVDLGPGLPAHDPPAA